MQEESQQELLQPQLEKFLNTAATADTALNITDTALDIVDSGIEIAKDLITKDDKETEPISFENIDTSAIDNIELPEENIQEEINSLGDIKLPEGKEKTDFIDQIDNKISIVMFKAIMNWKNQFHLIWTKKKYL